MTSDVVQIWWADPTAIPRTCLDAHAARLPPEERAAANRFVFEADRVQSLVARALVRGALSEATGQPSDAWRFERTVCGRPFVAAPELGDVSFSVSHTRALVVCAIGQGPYLGIDVERWGPSLAVEPDPGFLSSAELSDLRAVPEADRRRRLLAYWTLKEAYAKARGLGVRLPFDAVSFHWRAEGVTAAFAPSAAPPPEARWWRFFSGQLASHALAVARSHASPAPLKITFHDGGRLLQEVR
jgi:4'-phosphopantetheinyl transferase